MFHFLVIGIGPGDPELVTVKAINALNRADLVLIPRKGDDKVELAEARREICRRYLENETTRLVEFDLPKRGLPHTNGYISSVNNWHDAIAVTYTDVVRRELPAGGTVALLVWGDPSLYDSTLRIIARMGDVPGFASTVEVIPGVTSLQALTAMHRIPLNSLGGSVLYTTGRRLKEGVPANIDTIVVMLDGDVNFRHLPAEQFDIYWGACLGLPEETGYNGRLQENIERIEQQRKKIRERNGWVMDIYILRRINREV